MGGRNRREELHLDLDALTTVFPLADVERVLTECNRMSERYRKLPAPMMVYLIIALGLMVSTGAKEVLRRLRDKVRHREWIGGVPLASEAAICKARKKIGVEPIRMLFEQVARPVAKWATRGAWFRRRLLVTIDGSSLHVQDSKANDQAFGRPKNAGRVAAFPMIRFVMLIENGTRIPLGAAMDRWSVGETTLAVRVLGLLRKGMLCLADRRYYSYELWTQAVATGADLLWRVPRRVKLPRLKVFSDRSYLSRICRPKASPIDVRVVEYTVKIGSKVEHFRLITTILNPRSATAMDLARLYTQRWTIESSLQEIKTWLRGHGVVLRSKLPELVEQDFYGLLLAYFGVRCLIHEGALEEDIEPSSISFLHALNVVIQRLPEIVSFSPSGQAALP